MELCVFISVHTCRVSTSLLPFSLFMEGVQIAKETERTEGRGRGKGKLPVAAQLIFHKHTADPPATVVLHLIILSFSGDKDPPIRWSVAPGRTLPYLFIIQRGIEIKRFSILKLLSRRWSFFKSNLGDISFPPCVPIYSLSLFSP